MSLRIRRIAVNGFRKFREPMAVDGLTDGLNIVIEPNETGKSTLLEALRAAFFVRHSTKNQLAQSFAPHGEAVAPEIEIRFEADGVPWSVTKRFLKGASIEISGPKGRAQGDEAESRMHALLGSVRDTTQRGDPASYGALGLLWVAQTEALSVTAPGQIVRDTVRSTLEAEVGSIMGGPAYKRVRDRIEEQFSLYWTPTGQRRGRQVEANERLSSAETSAREAAIRLADLERGFGELAEARGRLKVIQREIADPTDAEARKVFSASLDVARAAAQILATRRAEQEAASGKMNGLEELQSRHESATTTRDDATRAADLARERRCALAGELGVAKVSATETRLALETARTARREARAAHISGEARFRAIQRRNAISSARIRHIELLALELQECEAKQLSANLIPAKAIALLEASDRAVAEAYAIVNAGATLISLTGNTTGILIDGETTTVGERKLTRETRITFGEADLLIRPPLTAASAEEALAAAQRKQRAVLDEHGVEDLAGARTRNDIARDAAAELRTLQARIDAATAADATLSLDAGPDALKLFMAEVQDETDAADDKPDIAALTKVVDRADTTLARAEGAHDSAIAALRRVEDEDAPLATMQAGADSDLVNAKAQLHAIENRPDFAALSEALALARSRAAEAAVQLEEAVRNATALDPAAITKKIEMIDARVRTAGETRTKLEMEIARLEGTIESEGGKGLADREALAREEAEAARAALQRISEEANMLKLLRDTLEAARTETSSKFVGPIAKRAKRYIERLLPGCDLTFSEDLGLETIVRAGLSEGCANLSRGTQEQLAVLTRIAFADMLLEQGRPVSLILDDPLVYSDDARLDVMIDILLEVSERMQVILLTCRDRAFRHVPANRISLLNAA
ncbi:AAA family ATPase [Glacieibacterium megasporae]|uniref:AAA family ATPase n=1 Tax=Glacieibacterium megasporae TaxID=2835787 RepID=UPI001C1DD49F|nr:AAA family ATPase [Polymorphobacter megasporae]UAJ12617.1 AAA family ATPase [Polymorphobacter megasporae]